MSVIKQYDKEIHSVFQLFGYKENDITCSLSWVLYKCPKLLESLVEKLTGGSIDHSKVIIRNQQYDSTYGITDIEATDNEHFYLIFEAKRGWVLPAKEQLIKYANRKDFQESKVNTKFIVILSECTNEYAELYLPIHSIQNIPVVHLSWQNIYMLSSQAVTNSNYEQKYILREFIDYMKEIMTMQKKDSNLVYVVALSRGFPENSTISWIDVVRKRNMYFCPVGVRGWPKEPPNYIAFRYYGKLQSIHHIDHYTISKNLHNEILEMPNITLEQECFVYQLGPAIFPSKEVKTGKIYRNGRVWAMLDTLLTCDTISEARDLTKER